MDCPQCGYVLDPFQKECPRCARTGGKAPAATAPATSSAQQVKTVARDAASQFKAEPLIRLKMEEPELGWALAASLWSIIVIDGLLLLVLFFCIVFYLSRYLGGFYRRPFTHLQHHRRLDVIDLSSLGGTLFNRRGDHSGVTIFRRRRSGDRRSDLHLYPAPCYCGHCRVGCADPSLA